MTGSKLAKLGKATIWTGSTTSGGGGPLPPIDLSSHPWLALLRHLLLELPKQEGQPHLEASAESLLVQGQSELGVQAQVHYELG